MNTFIASGHITKDATTRTVVVGGTPTLVTDFTVAVNNGHGDYRSTDFIKCSIWRNHGAALAQYLTKGRAVNIKGAVKAQAWIATQGESAGKAMAQLVMSNPDVELVGKNGEPAGGDDVPFEPEDD